jgi:hypothetical protein
MKYVRKPSNVEATQVSVDFTHDGNLIPAGHWLVVHEDGRAVAVNDADFASEYEPAPAEAAPEAPAAGPIGVPPEGPTP